MPASQSTALPATSREPAGSRAARRLRRQGLVLGIVYGGGQDPLSFQVDARELRNTLAHAGAVIDLQIDAEASTPVVLKELTRHPVSGAMTHVDLIRVDLRKPIQAQVALELLGADTAPGVVQGGVLEHSVRELTVEALPNAIPDVIQLDISDMDIGGHVTLSAIQAPAGATIIGDTEMMIATIHPPRLRDSGSAAEEAEIELETEVVGEAGAEAAAEPAAEGDEPAGGDAGGDGAGKAEPAAGGDAE